MLYLLKNAFVSIEFEFILWQKKKMLSYDTKTNNFYTERGFSHLLITIGNSCYIYIENSIVNYVYLNLKILTNEQVFIK